MALVRDRLFWGAFVEHAQHTLAASEHLLAMLRDLTRSSELAREIKALELRGDEITRKVVHALHQTWITPLDREEIHALITGLDDVLDEIEAASDRLALYEVRDVRPEALELALSLTQATSEIVRAVSELSNLRDGQAVRDACRAIAAHEHEADRILRGALARLFNEGGDPVEVVKWRDIFDALEAGADRADDVANVLEGIVLEHG